jgi:hypothetical protein
MIFLPPKFLLTATRAVVPLPPAAKPSRRRPTSRCPSTSPRQFHVAGKFLTGSSEKSEPAATPSPLFPATDVDACTVSYRTAPATTPTPLFAAIDVDARTISSRNAPSTAVPSFFSPRRRKYEAPAEGAAPPLPPAPPLLTLRGTEQNGRQWTTEPLTLQHVRDLTAGQCYLYLGPCTSRYPVPLVHPYGLRHTTSGTSSRQGPYSTRRCVFVLFPRSQPAGF